MADSPLSGRAAEMSLVLVIHVAATWALVGLIWFVQIVHYPLFGAVGQADFVGYEALHTRRTSWVVGVFMPVEAITAVWLVADRPESVGAPLAIGGLLLVIALWASTAAWQAPIHRRLSQAYDAEQQRLLVKSNWVRTALWSARGGIALTMVGQALS